MGWILFVCFAFLLYRHYYTLKLLNLTDKPTIILPKDIMHVIDTIEDAMRKRQTKREDSDAHTDSR